MPTAHLLTDRPLVEFDADGLRVLKRELAVDLGVELIELHEWGHASVTRSTEGTTRLSVPAGFPYDGASIPALVVLGWVMGPRELYECAGAFHDALYRWQAPRDIADLVFWILARSGSKQVTPTRAWFGWAGIRVGGWYAYWRRRREAIA